MGACCRKMKAERRLCPWGVRACQLLQAEVEVPRKDRLRGNVTGGVEVPPETENVRDRVRGTD